MSTNNRTIYGEFSTTLNITTATVIKAATGTIISYIVEVAGSAPGSINDVATDAPDAANQVVSIPNAVSASPVKMNWPCKNGILVVPGAGQTVAVQWQ